VEVRCPGGRRKADNRSARVSDVVVVVVVVVVGERRRDRNKRAQLSRRKDEK
jgi:hypothetical protein